MKIKRGTDLFDDEAKARLVGFSYGSTTSTSGSKHEGGNDDHDEDSPCLSDLLQRFYEEEEEEHDENRETKRLSEQQRCDRIEPVSRDVEQQQEQQCDDKNAIESTISDSDNCNDIYANALRYHVTKAIDVFSCLKSSNISMFRRNVMCYLRNVGYDAAICKSKWDESSGGLSAGSYEYIDVIVSKTTQNHRYVIDVDFAAQFSIARRTEEYSRKVEALPGVYVGRDEELKRVVRAMCDAARRSLKINELQLPPWRKNRYMMMKWFDPYKRSTKLIPANESVNLPTVVSAVKCQFVGFDTGVNGRYSVRTA